MKTLLGFDIGGTKCAVILGKYDGDNVEIIAKEVVKTDKNESPFVITKKLGDIGESLLNGHGVDLIGISCGGPLDSKRGVVMSPPNLPLWDNFPICDILSKRLGAPAKLQNDANACAVAEYLLGSGKGTQNMVFMTFGTGLGAGLILNGRLYEGTNGNAGELGHIKLANTGPIGYGKEGSFEGFCSGGGLAQLGYLAAREQFEKGNVLPYFNPKMPLGGITAKILADAAQNGDVTALSVFKTCGEYLGKGLSIIIDILNPERIVIGSIFTRSGKFMIDEMNRFINKEALAEARSVCEIVPAVLGENIGDYAALMTATL